MKIKNYCKRRSEKIILYIIIPSNLKSNNFKLFNDRTNLHSLGVDKLTVSIYNIVLFLAYLTGPTTAQSGQGGGTGQTSTNPSSSGERSPKYSNSSLPVGLGGGGRFGSRSEISSYFNNLRILH